MNLSLRSDLAKALARSYRHKMYPRISDLRGATALARKAEAMCAQRSAEPVLEIYQKLSGISDTGAVEPISLDWLYNAIIELEPHTVVETGVCNGASSYVILSALETNGKGQLHSIDYPFYANEDLEKFRQETFDGYRGAAIPADKEPGWTVPESLRSRWELIRGRSQDRLPLLLEDLDSIDIFLHDSEHSHDCMTFEYSRVWPVLEEGGLLVSDDTDWNNAFSEFSDSVSYRNKHVVTQSFKALVK
jgi:predicted O-methyltransferase YrrM